MRSLRNHGSPLSLSRSISLLLPLISLAPTPATTRTHTHSVHRALHKLRAIMDAPSPPEPGIEIVSVLSDGPGCPDEGDVEVEYTGHGPMPEAITFSYKKLMAANTAAGGVASPEEGEAAAGEAADGMEMYNEAECQIVMHLKQQQGWQFAVQRVDYTGSADLADGKAGVVDSAFAFVGRKGEYESRTELSVPGPHEGSYRDTGTLMQDFIVFSPCKQHLVVNVNATIKIRNDDRPGAALMTIEPDEGHLEIENHLNWKKCTPTNANSKAKSKGNKTKNKGGNNNDNDGGKNKSNPKNIIKHKNRIQSKLPKPQKPPRLQRNRYGNNPNPEAIPHPQPQQNTPSSGPAPDPAPPITTIPTQWESGESDVYDVEQETIIIEETILVSPEPYMPLPSDDPAAPVDPVPEVFPVEDDPAVLPVEEGGPTQEELDAPIWAFWEAEAPEKRRKKRSNGAGPVGNQGQEQRQNGGNGRAAGGGGGDNEERGL